MKFFSVFAACLFLVSCTESNFTGDFNSFEIRLADLQANTGLTKMKLYGSDTHFYVSDTVYLDNADLASAKVVENSSSFDVLVGLTMDGQEKFATFTQNNIGKNAAILIDNKLVSCPRINAQITVGKLIVRGFFNRKEARNIAAGIIKKT